MNAFWQKDQPDYLNSFQTITPDEGYLVNMNIAETLSVMGVPVQTRLIASVQSAGVLQYAPTGWQLIGVPFQTATPFSDYFNTTNSEVIKNFDGYWMPNGTTNSLQDLEMGKGYFLKQ